MCLGHPTYSKGTVGSKAWLPAFCQGGPHITGTAYIIQSSHQKVECQALGRKTGDRKSARIFYADHSSWALLGVTSFIDRGSLQLGEPSNPPCYSCNFLISAIAPQSLPVCLPTDLPFGTSVQRETLEMLSLPMCCGREWQAAWKRRWESGPGPSPQGWNCQHLSRHWHPGPGGSLEGPGRLTCRPAPHLLMLPWENVQAHGPPRVYQRSLSAVPVPERAVSNLP